MVEMRLWAELLHLHQKQTFQAQHWFCRLPAASFIQFYSLDMF